MPERKKARKKRAFLQIFGVTDGIRTHDNQNHNLGLYQLSYGHHCTNSLN
jgi:hypothetical protein